LEKNKLSQADIRGVVPISGVFVVGGDRLRNIFGDADSSKQASPQTHVRAKLPPFLVFYGEKEIAGLGKQAEVFGKVVAKLDNDITVKMIKDRDHGSIIRKAVKPDDEMTREIVAFITKHGGLKPSK